jgi:pimeloyl-ACP methyl ester carboxylesterase
MEDASGVCSLNGADAILPDIREGELLRSVGAVVVLNHTGRVLHGAEIEVGDGRVFERKRAKIQDILPYGLAKPQFALRQLRALRAGDFKTKPYELAIVLRAGRERHELSLQMPVRAVGDCYTVTRQSGIDGSVQKYAVRPPANFDKKREYALYLTLHGAGVDAYGQAQCYYPKFDAYVVAPTNRRPFGFDWQEWGRIDALETLDDFMRHASIDPDRVCLTGHSMGGHGTWYLGAVYPSKWAAIGPSAGWISFFSYAGGTAPDLMPGPLEPLERAKLESDTLALLHNFEGLPIYAVHGTADDNVPISELHAMVEKLKPFHADLHVHEEPGQGHWYDVSPYPGVDCVDYLPRNEEFSRRVRPAVPMRLRFATQNPAISSEHYWLQVRRQERSGYISTVSAEVTPGSTSIKVETKNVACLAFDLHAFFPEGTAVQFDIDGNAVKAAAGRHVLLSKGAAGCHANAVLLPTFKTELRDGPFKLAFDRNMVWVYGTHGNAEENAAILAKVRYDQECWWYRGNGNVLVIADRDFSPARHTHRNVILYGNSDTNSAFGALLKDCPVWVRRGEEFVAGVFYRGDLAAWYFYPRTDSFEDAVGVVGATSALATRRGFEPRYFTSGVSLPDYTVAGPDLLIRGTDAVLATGYFDNEWKLERERK